MPSSRRATPTRSRWRSSRPAGAVSRSRGSCQMRWISSGRGDAGDVAGGGGGPVELGERGLGGGDQRRDDLVAVERVGGLGDLRQQEGELGEVGVEPDEPGAGEAGVAVGDAEGQARDAVGADRRSGGRATRSAGGSGRGRSRRRCRRVGDAEQALAAEVDVEAGVVERPVGGNLDVGVRERDDAVAVRPGGAVGERASSKVQPSSGIAARTVQSSSSIRRRAADRSVAGRSGLMVVL